MMIAYTPRILKNKIVTQKFETRKRMFFGIIAASAEQLPRSERNSP